MKKILLLTILLMSGICSAEVLYYVDTDVVGGDADGSSWANAYATLNSGLQAEETDLPTLQQCVRFLVRGDAVDTTQATVDATWNNSSNYYVIIEADDDSVTGKHSGILSNSCYQLVVNGDCLLIYEPYTKVIGLQLKDSSTGSATCIKMPNGSGADYVTIKDCIFFNDTIGTSDRGIQTYEEYGRFINCIFYDLPYGIYDNKSNGGTNYIYNGTFHACTTAMASLENGDKNVARNCIFDNCTADSDGEFTDPNASDYNSSTNASFGWTSQTNDLTEQTHPFNDPDNGDFSLTAAVAGQTDPSSGLFLYDINRIIRGIYGSAWDRGAWEYSSGTPPTAVQLTPQIVNKNMN